MNIAIEGHTTRYKEVIELLEMLGGENEQGHCGNNPNVAYYISHTNTIACNWDYNGCTLEEFLKKYPYKVENKVQHKGATSCGTVYVIEHMNWVNDHIEYEISPLFDYNHTGLVTVLARDLQPYKEQETMEKDSILNQLIEYFKNTPRDIIEKEWHEYDKYNEIGPTVKEYLESINKSKYPKTYDECMDMFHFTVETANLETLKALRELIYCRNTYWRIIGEQMGLGLGKPWKPENPSRHYIFTIENCGGDIIKNAITDKWSSRILVFPTAEIRDTFYENFKELIEVCKDFCKNKWRKH